jgi:hypothetical protein
VMSSLGWLAARWMAEKKPAAPPPIIMVWDMDAGVVGVAGSLRSCCRGCSR